MAKQFRWILLVGLLALLNAGLWASLRSTPPQHRLGWAPSAGQGVRARQPPPAVLASPVSATVSPDAASSAAPQGESTAHAPRTPTESLEALVGPQAMFSLVQPADFSVRFVDLVDRLGRTHVPPGVWPLTPPTGPFLTDSRGGKDVIGIDNEFRYAPYVLLLESIDLNRAVEYYAALYPQFQMAYAARSASGQPFHERLMALLDQLLQAPELFARPGVHRADPEGQTNAAGPSVRYQFDGPALEAATTGQKLMVRMGTLNERRVKIRLAELRGLLHRLGSQR